MVGVSRCGLMAWVLLVLVLGAACVWVVGGSGRGTRGWWLVGLWSWGGGAGCLCCWAISFGGPSVCSDRLVLWVVGGVAVLPLSVVLVTVLVKAPPEELWMMPKARPL